MADERVWRASVVKNFFESQNVIPVELISFEHPLPYVKIKVYMNPDDNNEKCEKKKGMT
jgi:hypothetical protein